MFKLLNLFQKRHELPDQDKQVIESLHLEYKALADVEEMKNTSGWKILGTKLRQEVANEIAKQIKGNTKIELILGILSTVETKKATQLLEEEIDKIIPT